MLSNKPYLLRALYQWIVDSKCTPILAISASYPQCNIPPELIEAGQITLNISPSAVRDLDIQNDYIKFRASFSGTIHLVAAPIKSILAIYAQENEQGMFFEIENTIENGLLDLSPQLSDSLLDSIAEPKKNTSHLRLVE